MLLNYSEETLLSWDYSLKSVVFVWQFSNISLLIVTNYVICNINEVNLVSHTISYSSATLSQHSVTLATKLPSIFNQIGHAVYILPTYLQRPLGSWNDIWIFLAILFRWLKRGWDKTTVFCSAEIWQNKIHGSFCFGFGVFFWCSMIINSFWIKSFFPKQLHAHV